MPALVPAMPPMSVTVLADSERMMVSVEISDSSTLFCWAVMLTAEVFLQERITPAF